MNLSAKSSGAGGGHHAIDQSRMIPGSSQFALFQYEPKGGAYTFSRSVEDGGNSSVDLGSVG